MSLSAGIYFLFLLGVGAGRLFEITISNRNRQRLFENGGKPIRDPYFAAMVALHTSVLIGAFVEVIVLNRPFIPALGYPALIIFVLCNALRWWVIRSLAEHWNVKVVDSSVLGVVTRGPYRYVRHPNYTAVFLELLVIPLIHTALITAITGAVIHLWVLHHRIQTEERVLLANPTYRAQMGPKARFIPGVF